MFTPPVGFHFKVEVLGIAPAADDLRFVEVGGLARREIGRASCRERV